MSAPSRAPRVQGQSFADGDDRSAAVVSSPALFRVVNEEVERIAESLAFGEELELELVCECDRRGCLARIAVSRDAYEAVRRFPTRFLLKPEHAGGDDRIVEQTTGYVVVEKVGRSAESAILLDPRRSSAREEPR